MLYETAIILVFRQKERLMGYCTTPCIWNFGSTWPHSFKNADF